MLNPWFLYPGNKQGPLPENCILVTIDVSALYTNINKEEGMEYMRDALDLREEQIVPTEFIIDILKIILISNIFEFDQSLYVQNIGTSMGTTCAPTYANIFMSRIDKLLLNLATSLAAGVNPILALLMIYL